MNSRLRIYKILQAVQNASYITPKDKPIKINPKDFAKSEIWLGRVDEVQTRIIASNEDIFLYLN